MYAALAMTLRIPEIILCNITNRSISIPRIQGGSELYLAAVRCPDDPVPRLSMVEWPEKSAGNSSPATRCETRVHILHQAHEMPSCFKVPSEAPHLHTIWEEAMTYLHRYLLIATCKQSRPSPIATVSTSSTKLIIWKGAARACPLGTCHQPLTVRHHH
jgi:hypothetical protein